MPIGMQCLSCADAERPAFIVTEKGNSGSRQPSFEERVIRIQRWLLTEAFPLAVILAIAALGLTLQFNTGRIKVSPSSTASQLVGIIVVSGISSMAIVQIFKSLLGLRGLYQERQLKQWFVQQPDGSSGYTEFRMALTAADASDRGIRYLFDLPIDQLCAQVSGAADVALASPAQFGAFLRCLAGERAFRIDAVAGGGEGRSRDAESRAEEDRQIRLSHYVRAGIDQLQVSIGHRWRRYVRSAAVGLSGLIGIAIVEASEVPTRQRGLDILAALLVGGFVAWFARDVAALVERLRG